jgi:LysM repeat protein
VLLLTAVFTITILILGLLILRYQGPVTTFAFVPTATAVAPTPSYTPTLTPIPTETPIATDTPTITPSPAPTATPQSERLHILAAGETLFGLAGIYNVSVDSIAQVNELNPDAPVQAGQSLSIPWPTATPPLEAVAIEINGETVIALPDGCPRHEIQAGESIASIANQYGIDFDLLLRLNRLAVDTIVQPGQTVCIPEIRFGGDLPPTPGPSPTPAPTRFPAGPQLLYPVNNTVVDTDGLVTLQWAAVKDLNDNEWYMIELTDINVLDVPPYRGFTRDNSFQIPSDWRPDVPEEHNFRWRISIVQVTDWRADGQPIYEYGGRFSEDAFFTWLGAIPTATPTQTPAPTSTPTPEA